MLNGKMIQTNLKCNECGNVANIMRKDGEKRKKGHVKDLWCWKCKKETKHRDFIYEYDVFGAFALPDEEINELQPD